MLFTFLKPSVSANSFTTVSVPIPSYDNKTGSSISVRTYFESLNIPALSCEEGSNKDLEFNDLHEVGVLDEKYRKIIRTIPKHSGLSGWNNNECPTCSKINYAPDVFCQECNTMLSKPIVKSNGEFRLIHGFNTSYRRMRSDSPASTVLTASGSISSHNTIHPYEDRPLSPYECQVLQTFPDNFKWGETKTKYGISYIRKMIGEAVPPKFTRLHGRILYSLLSGNMRGRMMKTSDDKLKRAHKNLNN
jgi:DNA (cytosine-5)-methyltransferase 1